LAFSAQAQARQPQAPQWQGEQRQSVQAQPQRQAVVSLVWLMVVSLSGVTAGLPWSQLPA
jgi:hypothetical protein